MAHWIISEHTPARTTSTRCKFDLCLFLVELGSITRDSNVFLDQCFHDQQENRGSHEHDPTRLLLQGH